MPKQTDNRVLSKPLPSARVPWLIIFCLLACIVLVYMGFLRPVDKLLGPPLPRNEYWQYMKAPKPPTPSAPSPASPAPAIAH